MNENNREIKAVGKILRCDEKKLKADIGNLNLATCIGVEVGEMPGKFVGITLFAKKPLSAHEKNNLRRLIIWSEGKLEAVKEKFKATISDLSAFDVEQLENHFVMMNLGAHMRIRVDNPNGTGFKKVILTSSKSRNFLYDETELPRFLKGWSSNLLVVHE